MNRNRKYVYLILAIAIGIGFKFWQQKSQESVCLEYFRELKKYHEKLLNLGPVIDNSAFQATLTPSMKQLVEKHARLRQDLMEGDLSDAVVRGKFSDRLQEYLVTSEIILNDETYFTIKQPKRQVVSQRDIQALWQHEKKMLATLPRLHEPRCPKG